jgi:hypothetical protein
MMKGATYQEEIFPFSQSRGEVAVESLGSETGRLVDEGLFEESQEPSHRGFGGLRGERTVDGDDLQQPARLSSEGPAGDISQQTTVATAGQGFGKQPGRTVNQERRRIVCQECCQESGSHLWMASATLVEGQAISAVVGELMMPGHCVSKGLIGITGTIQRLEQVASQIVEPKSLCTVGIRALYAFDDLEGDLVLTR